VRSIVDRFLEHSRIYYYENACQPEVYVSSADWLPRNLFRRIEIAFPIEDGVLRERLIGQVLATTLADNTRARVLLPDGTYRKLTPASGQKPRRSQVEFIRLAAKPESAGPAPVDGQGRKRFPQVKVIRRGKSGVIA
jgi:polyphosphate kinase